LRHHRDRREASGHARSAFRIAFPSTPSGYQPGLRALIAEPAGIRCACRANCESRAFAIERQAIEPHRNLSPQGGGSGAVCCRWHGVPGRKRERVRRTLRDDSNHCVLLRIQLEPRRNRLTSGAIDSPAPNFKSLAAAHATAGGINEQFLERLVARGLLTGVSEAPDATLRRIGAERQSPDRGATV